MASRKPIKRPLNASEELKQALAELAELKTNRAIHDAMENLIQMVNETNSRGGRNEETLQRIEEQTIKTNGRVTALEMWRAKSAGTMAAIGAGVAVIGWLINFATGFFQR
jgi:hypothetical protein